MEFRVWGLGFSGIEPRYQTLNPKHIASTLLLLLLLLGGLLNLGVAKAASAAFLIYKGLGFRVQRDLGFRIQRVRGLGIGGLGFRGLGLRGALGSPSLGGTLCRHLSNLGLGRFIGRCAWFGAQASCFEDDGLGCRV